MSTNGSFLLQAKLETLEWSIIYYASDAHPICAGAKASERIQRRNSPAVPTSLDQEAILPSSPAVLRAKLQLVLKTPSLVY